MKKDFQDALEAYEGELIDRLNSFGDIVSDEEVTDVLEKLCIVQTRLMMSDVGVERPLTREDGWPNRRRQ